MELILTVVRYQNRPAQPASTVRIGIAGGTIGRGPDNELVLTDPERWVGRQHARISFRDGAFFLVDTSKNGTLVNNVSEPLQEGREAELHDGDVLGIGAYEIRVSREDSQPRPAAPVDLFADGKPELDPSAQAPSDRAAPDIMDLVAGTPAETNPFSPSPTPRQAPDDWLTVAPPEEEGPRVPEPESPATPAAVTEPDHTPHQNAFYSPPEAIPEDYDILADASHPQPTERDLPTADPESPPGPTASDPAPIEGQQERDLSIISPESPPAPPASEGVAKVAQASSPASKMQAGTPALGPTDGLLRHPPSGVVSSGEQPSPPARERTREIRPAPAPVAASEVNALQAFLAGLDAGELPADRQAQAELMRTTGLLLRAMTEGLMRVLVGRTSFKSELRLEMTTIRSAENNPFKFSVDPADALAHLLFRPSRGFLPPLEAARESFDDIQCHEMALVAGLRAALHALLKRMDPAELENRFRDRSVIDNLVPMARKAKYWDLFTETYQAIAADAADDFLNLFRDAFSQAYEDQAARLRQARSQDRTSP